MAFICDFSAENLSRAEVAKYIAFVSSYWKFYREHLVMKNYKVACVGDFLINKCFEFWHQFMCYSNNLSGKNFFACLLSFLHSLLVFTVLDVILPTSINMRSREKVTFSSYLQSLLLKMYLVYLWVSLLPLLIKLTFSNSWLLDLFHQVLFLRKFD